MRSGQTAFRLPALRLPALAGRIASDPFSSFVSKMTVPTRIAANANSLAGDGKGQMRAAQWVMQWHAPSYSRLLC